MDDAFSGQAKSSGAERDSVSAFCVSAYRNVGVPECRRVGVRQ